MRRILSLFLLTVLGVSLFAGCGTETSSTDSVGGQSSDTALPSTSRTDEEKGETSQKPEKKSAQEIMEEQESHLVGLCDQKNGRIIVCDLNEEDWSGRKPIVWEYKHWTCGSVAGLKLRYSKVWDKEVVIYCHNGGAAIIDYDTKEQLFYTREVGCNPHSVELLPDNTFIVASSTDNKVSVFSAETVASGAGNPSQELEHPNAHGVLWDPKYEVVWMEGMNQLSAYVVKQSQTAPQLIADPDMVYNTPTFGLHDLAPCYGDPDALFVTCEAGILKFDKVKETFTTGYPGGNVGKSIDYAPGAGNFGEDNVLVYTSIVEGQTVHFDWCTDTVCFYVPNADNVGKTVRRTMEGSAFYKVRVWSPDYQ